MEQMCFILLRRTGRIKTVFNSRIRFTPERWADGRMIE
jgi:hypothetical protein